MGSQGCSRVSTVARASSPRRRLKRSNLRRCPVAADVALEVRGARVRFGVVVPCDGVDISVRAGEIVGIIGPNGAGKSTLLDAISGFAPMEAGTIAIDGVDVTRALPYRRA